MAVKMKVMNVLEDMLYQLDNLIFSHSLMDKEIVIWGIQKASYIASQYLCEKGCNVIGFADNNYERNGEFSDHLRRSYHEVKRIDIFAPQNILLPHKEDTMILVFSRCYEDILKQALEYGYSMEQCLWVYNSEEKLGEDELGDLCPISIEEQKRIEFNIMCYLKRICNQYKLRYFMSAGTLLGAVRHKGFIPWDDDIDIYMPWDDYNRLIELFEKGAVGEGIYSLMYHGLCDNYSWIYAKLQDNRTVSRGMRYPLICEIGVNIDIFPMGGFPAEGSEQDQLKKRIEEFHLRWSKHLTYWGINQNYCFTSTETEIRGIMSQYDFDSSPYVGYILDVFYSREISSRKTYEKSIDLEFEGEFFSAPVGYNEYLTHTYGDYMELPPEWNRKKTPHIYKAFWK